MNRLLADQQMRAVQLGTEMHGEIELAHGCLTPARIRQRDGQIAAKADQRFRAPIVDRLHRRDGIMPVMFRWHEAVGFLDVFKHKGRRLLRDADSAVALHVGMAAQRADAGAWLADIAAQQQQAGDLVDIRRAGDMLGDAHAIGHDRRVGSRIGLRHHFQSRARQAGSRLDIRPGGRLQIGGEHVETIGVLGDEFVIQHG